MALEFICSNQIVKGNKIKVPEGATHYKGKSWKVKFFYYNSSEENGEIHGFKLIPFRAKVMCFNSEGNKYTIEYGEPDFFNAYGTNILKAWKGLFNNERN